MKLYKHMAILLLVSEAVNTDQEGSTYRVETSAEDGVFDTDQDYQVYFHATQEGGAESPTSQITLQTSVDNQRWVDVVQSTQLTADGEKTENKTHATACLCRYVRAVTTLGGGTKPNHTCEVRLVSNGAFRARLVS